MKVLEKEFLVKEINSAKTMGSGDLLVLATPALVAFVEQTCKELSVSWLESGETTVGSMISLQHLRPTRIGETIKVKASFLKQTKKILTFEFSAYEGELEIARGEHLRGIVNANDFMNRLNK